MVTQGRRLGPLQSSAGVCLLALALSSIAAFAQSSSPDIIWQTATNSDRINTCLFSHDGSKFIAGSSDRLINIWNASDGTLLQTLDANAPEVHDSSVESLAINPAGTKLVSVNNRQVKLWTLPAGTLQTLSGHTDWVVGCAFSPSGNMFATASFDTTIKVWNSSGTLIKTFTSPAQKRCVVFSPDGSMLASAGGDNVVTIRRTSDWSTVNTLTGHSDSIYAIAWSPNGAYIGTGSYDQTAKVWNVSDGSLRFTVGNNNGNIYGVSFSPDSTTFAFTSGEGNSIKLVRTSDGAVTRTYTSNVPNVQCLAYSPQGTIGYGRVDRTVVVARVSGSGGGTISPPSITLTSPQDGASYNTGANINLNATASAGAGVQKVEFFVNNSSVAVDTASPYTASIPSAAKGSYTVRAVVTAKDGRTASDSASITVSDAPPESTPPRVVIRGPANGSRLLTNNPVLFGTASDNIAVAQVLVAVNSDDFQQADGTTSWQMQLNLNAGPNTIQVKAVDTSGNQSAITTWRLTYIQSSQISVNVSGSGRVSPDLNGKMIQIGQRCGMTAIPAAGYVFNGWSGDMNSSSQTVSFTMEQDMSLEANFIPNPFIPVMGTYNGLVTTDQPDVDHEGSFRATVSSWGSFSAQIYFGKQVFAFSGKFTGDGDYSTTINRSGTAYLIVLQLHVSDSSDQLTGTISDGAVTGTISADRWTWNARNNPAPAGRYTVLIPGGETSDQPQGAGWGNVTVTTSGSVIFVGRLSDGTSVSRATYLAKDRSWPLFVWASGIESALGQISVEDIPGTSDMDGEITWYRRQSPSRVYPNGFAMQSSFVASQFTAAPRGNNVLGLDLNDGNVAVAIGGGDTVGELDFTGTLDQFNRFLADDDGSSMRFRMTLSNASGMMSGTFVDPATGRTVAFQGIVFQKQDIAAGFWLGNSLSGFTVIQGN
jgi:uncharacterized repeat protein (TIGR02543 family)